MKSEEVKKIWNQYQEQPGLLDSHLNAMVDMLIGCFSRSVALTMDRVFAKIEAGDVEG